MINFSAFPGVSRLIVMAFATKLGGMAKRRGVRQLPNGRTGDQRAVRARASLVDAIVKRVAAEYKVTDALAFDLLFLKVAPVLGLEDEAREALERDGMTPEDLLRFIAAKEQDGLPLEVPMAS
ncbi:hypothetical protein ACVDFE_00290 [Lentzea chajnantorensis]